MSQFGTAIVIFGATGDLTHRKLFPALYQLFLEGLLPDDIELIGFARRDKNDVLFRQEVEHSLQQFSGASPDQESVISFLQKVFYHRSSFDDLCGYQQLEQRLRTKKRCQILFYLAAGPDQFPIILANLKASNLDANANTSLLTDADLKKDSWRRLVVEKPFGTDLKTAEELNQKVHEAFPESSTYRIDHYLGKEAAQNIMALRFANPLIESSWNRHFIERVEIIAQESLGVEGRGGYYDHAGALRDMVQNHLLQLLCLVAMEPPKTFDADTIRDQKGRVLSSILAWNQETLTNNVIRAQYSTGQLEGRELPGYRQEDRVSPTSMTETYVALHLSINNDRWQGVPFLLEAGKRMPTSSVEVIVTFKQTGAMLANSSSEEKTRLIIRIQPHAAIEWEILGKTPGAGMKLTPMGLKAAYAQTFTHRIPEAYERLLLDALRGDATLFARSDEVEAAWKCIDPIEQFWATSTEDLQFYPAGSRGPKKKL